MKKRVRSKNLSADVVQIIVQLLDGWASKLTWDHLISAIDFRIQQHYTRQALSNQNDIKIAYDIAKQRLSTSNNKPTIKNTNEMLLKQLQTIKNENEKLKKENGELLEQSARWVYNATTNGITFEQLNKPLAIIKHKDD
jgi:hypothetical protein